MQQQPTMAGTMPMLFPTQYDEAFIRDVLRVSGLPGLKLMNIPIQQYHDGPGVSSTDIKTILASDVPVWMKEKKKKQKSTAAKKLGNAAHCMTLEPEHFWHRYVREDEIPSPESRSTLAGKSEWKQWCCEVNAGEIPKMKPGEWAARWLAWKHPHLAGKESLSEEDVLVCEGVAKSVASHPVVSTLFKSGESEVTLYWIDPETDILCKARPDRLNRDFPCIPDLKTCASAAPDAFEGDITEYGYNISAWWYLWGAQTVDGFDYKDFVYVPAEKVDGCEVTYYLADQGSLDQGQARARVALAAIKKHREAGNKAWQGYSTEARTIGIRGWAFFQPQRDIENLGVQGMGLEKYLGGA